MYLITTDECSQEPFLGTPTLLAARADCKLIGRSFGLVSAGLPGLGG
jgi:hypothetical protein